MNPVGIPLKEPSVSAAAGDTGQLERALIDASTRVPVLIFYTSAVAWLILGTLLAGFVSFKLHTPDLLSDISFLTWGRVRPAHMNVMVYGWASMAGMGTAIWLMARLCRTVLRYPLLLVAGAGFWNLGVLLGVGGILLGDSTGYQWLEFPSYAAIILFVAYALVASWEVLMFRFRRGEQIYITQWYLLGAFLWFPWLYAAGQLMLFVVPVQGVLQAAVGWWYANNLLFLWFGAIGLGTAYYMIPKVIGRPVYSYHLATIGFWSYALFSSWTGMQRLVDGPFPAWMITARIAATILTMIPVATVGLNHHMTMQGYFPLMRYSPTLRFTVFGAMSYTVFSVIGVLISLRSVARYVNFTQASIAYSHLGLYAFFTMVIFGSMYYIVPRLIGREWRYASLIKLHFWASAYGIGLMTLMLLAGGFLQVADMQNPTLAFSESIETTLPYLRGRSLAGILLTASHFIFAYHFGLMLLGLGRTSTVPTFIRSRNRECSSAARTFTPRTAAFIVTASKCAPITQRLISNENGAIVEARRAITFSNGQCFSGKCAWARTSRISVRAPRRSRRALPQLAPPLLQLHRVEEQVPQHRLRRREEHQPLVRRLRKKLGVLLPQRKLARLHQPLLPQHPEDRQQHLRVRLHQRHQPLRPRRFLSLLRLRQQ